MAEESENATELSVQGESLQRLYSYYVQDRFLVNRRYQRKLVWAVEEKERLIDSVLKRLPIPLILLAESSYDSVSRFEVIDGLQRLNALFSFIENEFPVDGYYFDLETLADTKYLKDGETLHQKEPVLARASCRDFANYQLPVSTYRSASESSVDEVFRRINSSGKHLSSQEIRQAGSTADIARLVRRISAAIRGDASFTDYVQLQNMPKISITNHDLGYGIYDANIFWVKQGILSREAVRESRDEELVLDILLDLILEPLASSGTEYRNAAYGDERGNASTSIKTVRTRLITIGEAEVERRFMVTLDLLKETFDQANAPFSLWTMTQQNPRGVPRHFHALFIALAHLTLQENLSPKSLQELSESLKGFWDKDLSVPGGGNWGSERKTSLINAVKGHLRQHFTPTTDTHKVHLQQQAIQFESTLRMALTEESLFELKQGFCRVNAAATFDERSFDKVLRTASAMANSQPGKRGLIFIGVADDKGDAEAIERFHGVRAHQVDRFYVTGTQHELTAIGRSPDEHFRWLIERITNSKLQNSFANSLASTLTPFRYKDYLLWKLEPIAEKSPVTFDEKFYDRQGPMTVEVSDPMAVVELVRRFPG
uniref:GmrSD restriction endonuclease domain-containing protein n=1 Tax=Actinomadura rifamycini TaxID=31962 RepID=UPI003F4905F9